MGNENKETKEPQEPEGTPGETQPNPNGAPIPEDLEVIKAELEEERQAKATAEAALAEKDALIPPLQAQLSEAKSGSEAAAAELTQVKEAHSKAVAKYLDVVRASNS